MPTNPSTVVRVAQAHGTAAQSKARKQFNSLVKRLEEERAYLAQWHTTVPAVRSKADRELEPLCLTLWEREKALVYFLDRQGATQKLTNNQRQKLFDVICSMCEDLLEERDDEELKTLLDELLGPEEPDGEDAEALLNDMFQDLLGIEIDPDIKAHGTPEEVREAIDAAMRARMEKEGSGVDDEPADSPRPKKASARETRQKAEEIKLQQSVREIFRKLTSALHPDREQDPAERERKTALMQRVNVAYGANDLLGLLELQMEIEQIDQTALDRLDDTRIKQYNKILAKQIDEIESEVIHFEFALLQEFQMSMHRRPTPQQFAEGLDQEIVAMRNEIDRVERQLTELGDLKKLKAWLKAYRLPEVDDYPDFPLFGAR